MDETRVRTRRLWQEALLALVVLALAFLNFGHTSAVFAAGGRVVVTAQSVCGDPGALPSAGDHFACHGCKPEIAVLPPVPQITAPVSFAVTPTLYILSRFTTWLRVDALPGNPRGPPLI